MPQAGDFAPVSVISDLPVFLSVKYPPDGDGAGNARIQASLIWTSAAAQAGVASNNPASDNLKPV